MPEQRTYTQISCNMYFPDIVDAGKGSHYFLKPKLFKKLPILYEFIKLKQMSSVSLYLLTRFVMFFALIFDDEFFIF